MKKHVSSVVQEVQNKHCRRITHRDTTIAAEAATHTPPIYRVFRAASGTEGLSEQTNIAKHTDVKRRNANCVLNQKKIAEECVVLDSVPSK